MHRETGSMMKRFESPFGPLYIAADSEGKLIWCDAGPPPPEWECRKDDGACRAAAEKLGAYFSGKVTAFFDVLPVQDEKPRTFAECVLRSIEALPYGTTASYAAIAEACGNRQAARAAGTAAAANRTLIAVPCHRVVPAAFAAGEKPLTCKSVGSYRLGSRTKAALLELERRALRAPDTQR
jgi:methylated-DNA-[protein]-cysteine S-methyltransferase